MLLGKIRNSVCLGIAHSKGLERHRTKKREWNGIPQKNVFWKSAKCFSLFLNGLEQFSKVFLSFNANKIPSVFSLLWNGLEQNFKHFYFIFLGILRNKIPKFQVIFSSTKWFGTEFRAFVSSAEWFGAKLQSSECFSLLQNGLEQNSSFFIFCGMAWNGIPSISVLRNSRNSDNMNQNIRLFRVPRNNYFLRKWQP